MEYTIFDNITIFNKLKHIKLKICELELESQICRNINNTKNLTIIDKLLLGLNNNKIHHDIKRFLSSTANSLKRYLETQKINTKISYEFDTFNISTTTSLNLIYTLTTQQLKDIYNKIIRNNYN